MLLDFSIHGPEEYEGKSFFVNDIEYIIGEFISMGEEMIVHKAINKESTICSHVVKIYRKQDDRNNFINGLLSYKLKREVGMDVLEPIIPTKPNGLFLLQNLVTYNREGYGDALNDVKNLYKAKLYSATLTEFENYILSVNTNNTEALLGIALSKYSLNQLDNIFELFTKILKIEPYSVYYLEISLLVCLKLYNRNKFLELYLNKSININKTIDGVAKETLIDKGYIIDNITNREIDALRERYIEQFSHNYEFITLADLHDKYSDKEDEYNELTELAYNYIKNGCIEKALEYQRQASEIYPIGFESKLNQLLYCINKSCKWDNAISPGEMYGLKQIIYYRLNYSLYKIKMKQFDKELLHALMGYYVYFVILFNTEKDIDNLPSMTLWYGKGGTIEAPFRETYKVLLMGYDELKKIGNNKDIIVIADLVSKYKALAESQYVPDL